MKTILPYININIPMYSTIRAGQTLNPLAISIIYKHDEMTLLLLEHADIHAENSLAFIESCSNDNLAIVQLFVEKGVDINARKGRAFRESVHYSQYHIVDFLIENTINIENALINSASHIHDKFNAYLYEKCLKFANELNNKLSESSITSSKLKI